MSRNANGTRTLKTECLSKLALSESAVEAIFGMEGTLPKHAVDNLCLSHERLRAELHGAMKLLEEITDMAICKAEGMAHSLRSIAGYEQSDYAPLRRAGDGVD
jgi:hypothetical protein